MGRATNGVTLFKVAEDEHVVSAALIPADGEGEAEGDGGKSEGAPAQA
jgi:DNA gyrase subunit A